MSAGVLADQEAEAIDTELDPDELVEQLERTDWVRVPGMSSSTAATFAQAVRNARRDLREGQ